MHFMTCGNQTSCFSACWITDHITLKSTDCAWWYLWSVIYIPGMYQVRKGWIIWPPPSVNVLLVIIYGAHLLGGIWLFLGFWRINLCSLGKKKNISTLLCSCPKIVYPLFLLLQIRLWFRSLFMSEEKSTEGLFKHCFPLCNNLVVLASYSNSSG